jgi:hypothetical protein
MQEDTPPEKAETEAKLDSQETGAAETATREVHWSGKVGEQLRRDEQCLFETVGYAKAAFLSQPVSQPRSAVNLSCSPVSDMYSLPLQSHDRLLAERRPQGGKCQDAPAPLGPHGLKHAAGAPCLVVCLGSH